MSVAVRGLFEWLFQSCGQLRKGQQRHLNLAWSFRAFPHAADAPFANDSRLKNSISAGANAVSIIHIQHMNPIPITQQVLIKGGKQGDVFRFERLNLG